MKRIEKFIMILIVIFFISCSEDWLKPDPLSFYTPENVFVDKEGFESALVRCKKEINAENHGFVNFIQIEHAYSDLAVCMKASDFTQITPSSYGSNANNPPIVNFFLDVYGYIKNANTIISRIDDIEWSDQNAKERILSEALWFRSYWYYRLVNTYGDIPWEGKELKGPKLDYYSTSRWAILKKIQEDLEYAVERLPVTPARLGDVTKGAVNHLLAKVYLANCEFDKAIEATTEVINGPYALMNERFGSDQSTTYQGKESHTELNIMWDLHRVDNKNHPANTETIYATVDRVEAPPETRWNEVGCYSLRAYTPSYWKVMDSEGNRACNWSTPTGDTLGIGMAVVRTNHFFNYRIWEDEIYSWETTPDMRRADCNWVEMGDSISEIYTCLESSPNYGEPLSKKYYKSLADTANTWFSWPHYKLYVPTPNYHQPHGGPGDWYVFRLAETYLLRAEAYYWKDQLALAADDINKVRQRANAPLINASDVTIDYIFDERARELYAEEPRHSEMVRTSYIFAKLNRDGYNLQNFSEKNWYYDRVMEFNTLYKPPRFEFFSRKPTMNPEHVLWPIPQEVITANTLGRINQNIGYDGAELNEPPLETIPE